MVIEMVKKLDLNLFDVTKYSNTVTFIHRHVLGTKQRTTERTPTIETVEETQTHTLTQTHQGKVLE